MQELTPEVTLKQSTRQLNAGTNSRGDFKQHTGQYSAGTV